MMTVNNTDFVGNQNTKGCALLIDGNMRFQKMMVVLYQVVISNNQAASHGGGILVGSNIWNILVSIVQIKCLSNSAICSLKFSFLLL